MNIDEMTEAERQQALRTLANNYIDAWSTADANTREALVASVYADEAEFFSSEDGDFRLQGRKQIAANIGHVNERDIQGRGLAIRYTGSSVNHRAVTVTWKMVTGDGHAALTGMNVLMLDGSGEIAQDFIFIG